jgi:hypothetical protein
MNTYTENNVGLYISMMGHPKTLIPLVTAELLHLYPSDTAPMEHVMYLVERYVTYIEHPQLAKHVREFVGNYLYAMVGLIIKQHNWGLHHTPKITGMLLEYVFCAGHQESSERFEEVAGNATHFVDKAFLMLH